MTMPFSEQKDWTWQQRARFFALGAMWAVLLTMGPVTVTLWDMAHNYTDPIDWHEIEILFVASAGPALVAYWQKHKADLRVPDFLVIPPEFRPAAQVKTETPHTTKTITEPDGTVTEVKSEHATTTTTPVVPIVAIPSTPAEPNVQLPPQGPMNG